METEILDLKDQVDAITIAKKNADGRAKALEEELEEEQKVRQGVEKARKKLEDEIEEARKQHDSEVETISKLRKSERNYNKKSKIWETN